MKIHASQFEYMVSQTKSGLVGQCLIIFLMNLLLHKVNFNQVNLYLWDVPCALLLIHRYMNFKRFYQDQDRKDSHQSRQWVRKYVADVLLMGLLWAVLFSMIIFSTEDELHYIAMAVGLGLSGAAIVTMGPVFVVYAAFVSPMLLTLIIIFFMLDSFTHTVSAMVTLLGLVYLLYTDYKYSANFSLLTKQNELLKEIELEALECLGKAGEYRDTDTGAHVVRVGYSAYLLALAIGMTEKEAKLLMLASPLHDVGKIGISDTILLKQGKLTDEEFATMKEHAQIGAGILKNAHSRVMQEAKIVAFSHHEKWDGSGYPLGLAGTSIPLQGRIVAIADVFDALTSDRPYKKGWTEAEAVDFLRKNAGSHFDPQLVEKFIGVLPKIKTFSAQLLQDGDAAVHPLLKLV